jgi:hypothetical protein
VMTHRKSRENKVIKNRLLHLSSEGISKESTIPNAIVIRTDPAIV